LASKTVFWCDLCGRDMQDAFEKRFSTDSGQRLDVCIACTKRLVQEVLGLHRIGDRILRPWCPRCQGKGEYQQVDEANSLDRIRRVSVQCKECWPQ
jgi:hypothetical protein